MDAAHSASFGGENYGQQIAHHHGNNYNYYAKTDEHPRKAFIKAMDYPGINDRRRQIYDARPRDYEWIWTTEFKQWLSEDGEDFFWITGKPASGKSTLMKYLAESYKLKQCLPQAHGPWLVVSFYFDFRAHDQVANSICGMFRSITQQIVENTTKSEASFERVDRLDNINTEYSGLIETLSRAVARRDGSILTFIDGLDEFNGDPFTLTKVIDLLKERSGMKVCLASRAEHAFNSAYKYQPFIRMHDFNAVTVRALVESAIDGKMYLLQGVFSNELKESIIERADGVVLWAHLVTVQLLELALQGASPSQLYQELQETRSELNAIYERMLNKISAPSRSEAAITLALLRDAQDENSSARLDELPTLYNALNFLSAQPDLDLPRHAELLLENSGDHILNLFGGLLDLVAKRPARHMTHVKHPEFYIVRLTHETLHAFLERSDWINQNLTKSFRESFPDAVWLRTFCLVLEKASDDLKDDLLAGILANKTSLASIWTASTSRVPYAMLMTALRKITLLARFHERLGKLSHDIVRATLNSRLAIFLDISAHDSIDYEPFWKHVNCLSPGLTCIDPLDAKRQIRVDLAIATMCFLHSYIELHFKNGTGDVLEDQQALLNVHFCISHQPFRDHPTHTDDIEMMTFYLLQNFGGRKCENAAYPMQYWNYLERVAHFYRTLQDAIIPALWVNMRQSWCDSCNSKHQMIYHWSRAACFKQVNVQFAGERYNRIFAHMEELLNILIKASPSWERNPGEKYIAKLLCQIFKEPEFCYNSAYIQYPQKLMMSVLFVRKISQSWSKTLNAELISEIRRSVLTIKARRVVLCARRGEQYRALSQEAIELDHIAAMFRYHQKLDDWSLRDKYYDFFSQYADPVTTLRSTYPTPKIAIILSQSVSNREKNMISLLEDRDLVSFNRHSE